VVVLLLIRPEGHIVHSNSIGVFSELLVLGSCARLKSQGFYDTREEARDALIYATQNKNAQGVMTRVFKLAR